MHLALNMSRYVLWFLFDLSHWRLLTNVLYSHGFELRQMVFADDSWIAVEPVWSLGFATDDSARK